MKQIKIIGNKPLKGEIKISGAKNSAVALIPAAILSDVVTIENIPNISDVNILDDILNYLGAEICKENGKLTINSKKVKNKPITEEFSGMLRASYYFMGALLTRFKKVEIYLPGGCKIGQRPINIHLDGFKSLGAKIVNDNGKYIISAEKLVGTDIELPFPSVGATINILLASIKARGITTIRNCAREPEVGNLIDFLVSMGAKIEGKDTDVLTVTGVTTLTGGCARVISDRIEAGTYIIAGALVGEELTISNIDTKHLESLLTKLKEMNANIKVFDDKVIASKSENLKPADIETKVYPGFPTDLQQPITSLLIKAGGISHIKENIYEDRFQNVKYLNQMGADIEINGDTIIVNGPKKLKGMEVVTSDLRAGAALILAALSAEGQTTIKEIKYVLRGYENIVKKLTNVGASISLIDA